MSKTILVIDDDAMNLKRAEFILTKGGYNVLTAASGKEGIEVLKKGGADLVLLDIEMPEMNGIRTLEQIRDDSAVCESRVMALTASEDEETRRKMDELGAVDILRSLLCRPSCSSRWEKHWRKE